MCTGTIQNDLCLDPATGGAAPADQQCIVLGGAPSWAGGRMPLVGLKSAPACQLLPSPLSLPLPLLDEYYVDGCILNGAIYFHPIMAGGSQVARRSRRALRRGLGLRHLMRGSSIIPMRLLPLPAALQASCWPTRFWFC